MAIISVDEMAGGSGSFSVSEAGKYIRMFRAISDYAGDAPGTAIQALGSFYGIVRGTPYATINSSDPNAFCTGISAQQGGEGDPLEWILQADYSWYSVNDVGGGEEGNPLLMPIDVSFGFRDYEHVVEMDITGKPLLNSAGDPYDPPVVINVPNQTLTVVRNEAPYNVALAYVYRNSINAGSFAGQSALFAKCAAITPKNIFHPNIGWYYQVTYEYEFMNPRNSADGKGFRRTILDRGLRKLDPNTGKPVAITLNGQPITQPMLLDGTGKLLAISGTPVYNEFQVFPELDFSVFNFDVDAITGTRVGFPS